MKHYELTYFISPQIKSEEIEKLNQEIGEFIQNNGGTIIKFDAPTPRSLAYQIKKEGSVFLVSTEFNSEPEKTKELEKKLQKETRILRYLLTIKTSGRRLKKRIIIEKPSFTQPLKEKTGKPGKKVELKEIEEKLDEILKE